jgi:branched-chain amino acid transport system ATP-binding protein
VLDIQDMVTGYGRIRVLDGITMRVGDGQRVSILGANGAGKSTLLRAVFGTLPVWGGEIRWEGRSLRSVAAYRRAHMGIAFVPDSRALFGEFSVQEHLDLAGRHAPSRWTDLAYDLFPELQARRSLPVRTLSGGQQQMVNVARAIAMGPRMLLLDEPSLGLAQGVRARIAAALQRMHGTESMSVLMVEQDIEFGLAVTDYSYVLQQGRVIHEGEAHVLARDPQLASLYLGGTISEEAAPRGHLESGENRGGGA